MVNSYTVETDTDLQSFIRTDSSVANCVFVYGQIVENYETLSKDYIWTISTAALQEVDKQVQEEKTQRQALENKVNQMETQLASLTTILTNAGLMNVQAQQQLAGTINESIKSKRQSLIADARKKVMAVQKTDPSAKTP